MDGLNEATGDLLVLGLYSLFYIFASILLHTVLGSVHGQAEDGRGLATVDKLPPEMLLQIFSLLPYSDILSVRCTNKSWNKLSQVEGLLKSVATRDFIWAPELIEHLPPYLEMTTETEDRNLYYLGQMLGLYKLCPDTSHERKAVYKQMNLEGTLDAPYIYCKDSTWKASDIMGSSNAYFWNTTASPTTSPWVDCDDYYGPVLVVRALAELPPACAITLSCPRVPEDLTCPETMGDYVATSHYICGRPVYKHVDRDIVLAVDSDGDGYWVVRSVVDGDVGDAENTAKKYLWGPEALTLCLKKDDLMNDDDTNWWTNDEERDLPELEVKCVTHGAAA